jgi:hypothetical protein
MHSRCWAEARAVRGAITSWLMFSTGVWAGSTRKQAVSLLVGRTEKIGRVKGTGGVVVGREVAVLGGE